MKDVREILEQKLQEAAPEVTTYWRRTPDWDQHLPAAQLTRTGGENGFIDRTDRVVIDVWSPDQAENIAEKIRKALVGQCLYVDGLGLLDVVTCSTLPHPVPYADPNVEQSTAEYRVTARLTEFEE
jgi:hypothetical protein